MASDLLLEYSKDGFGSGSLGAAMRCALLCKFTSLAAICVTSAYFGAHVAVSLHIEAAPDAKEPLSSTRTKPTINDSPADDLPGEQVLTDMQMSEARGCPKSTSGKDLPATAKQTSSDMRTSAAAECLSILRMNAVDSMGLVRMPIASRSNSRTQPHERLVTAFGVDNCFTTSIRNDCIDFRTNVEGLLKKNDTEWAALAARVKAVVQDELTTSRDHLRLFAVVQMITLKSMMHVLFGYDTSKHDVDNSMREIASCINKQWLRSKGTTEVRVEPNWVFKRQYGLLEALKEVLPQKNVDDRKDNPLNSLLPGYETMWRVVLRCFTEVTARGHPHGSEWCNIMQAFAETPTDGQLLHISGIQTSTSASQIGKETLRLYPPTRRVYREYKTTAGEVKTVAADIEACHRDPKTWAPDPLRFRPERWNGMEQRDLEDPIFMPFSAKPYSCPAKRRIPSYMPFGLGMIALLVGTLVKQTIGEWKMVGKLPGIEEPLDTEREAYSELWLERVVKGGGDATAGRSADCEGDDESSAVPCTNGEGGEDAIAGPSVDREGGDGIPAAYNANDGECDDALAGSIADGE
ncbi:hypothetical protein B0A55_10298 [Friedmanniomyces simplex]|uniref:Cytochrome P450 n=1 Tax=Friedmanniomyces simplex TaxID=329884 RepID=A0A4V5NFY8_9PEZI|nr:hypothetical protein B0A55_10298 [Friedmanniomyces simplex]